MVGWVAGVIRRVQSGFIYHYAFMMIIGVLALLTLVVRAHLMAVLRIKNNN